MIDLHLHLDGSLNAADIMTVIEEENLDVGIKSIEELFTHVFVPKNCESLNDYLNAFNIPVAVMQSKSAITYFTKSLLKRLSQQGIIYVEIRFAPQLHLKGEMKTQDEVVEAAIDGISAGVYACNGEIKAQLILCCMRNKANEKENLETIKTAKRYLGKGVCAVDLAGAEAIFKTENYKEIFTQARDIYLPYTIHAGEADGPESVRKAIEFGTKRIGHGIRSREDIELMHLLKEKEITLEMCPTSNFQTKAVPTDKPYPIREFMEMGIKTTINTDNMTVSGTTIENEFKLLRETVKLSKHEEKAMLINSANAAFLSDAEKQRLIKKIENRYR